jgi:hypothetical protein
LYRIQGAAPSVEDFPTGPGGYLAAVNALIDQLVINAAGAAMDDNGIRKCLHLYSIMVIGYNSS